MSVYFPRLRFCVAVIAAATILLALATTVPSTGATTRADAIALRVDAILARRGLGPDGLSVIDNIVRHDASPPLKAPTLVRELLARPLAAGDAAALFQRVVPAALRRLADDASADPPPSHVPDAVPTGLSGLLAVYLDDLAAAQQVLRSAATGARIDAPALIREVSHQPPTADRLRGIAAAVDPAAIDRATALFLDATGRFVRALRAAGTSLQVPDKPVRFVSAIGVVSIGTRGDDRHGPDAAVIIDPGGNDVYERAPATGGAVSVIVDLGGDDRYQGSDLVVHGLSAIVDFSGNDRYIMAGSGSGAAIAGAALLIDFSGDDVYEAEFFGQGAAAFGLGAVIDLRGNDTYRVRAGGQGFGLAGGVGLLWDRSGDDRYVAAGIADVFKRGGGLSAVQGAAFGFRTMLGGGIGILRDDAGNDVYEAEMFAQGVGFYYGVGLLWDGSGDDHYRAVRYAQGNGVHEAIGLLRDESGNDRYELTVGVGQGMGLDLAVGMLFDGAGDDHYRAPVLAQGAATANGLGIVVDGGGNDHWEMGADRRSWGHAEWSRRLPSIGLLIYDPARARFTREGKTVSPSPYAAEFGGPLGDAPVAHEQAAKPGCPEVTPATTPSPSPLVEALPRIAPGFGGGSADAAAYADVQRQLTTRLQASIAGLPRDNFNITWALGEALRCTLVGAASGDAAEMWNGLENMLSEDSATAFAGMVAYALSERPPPAPQAQRILRLLEAHPRCGVRAAALSLHHSAANADASREPVTMAARQALRSSCWRLQATARDVLNKLGVDAEDDVRLPSFFRAGATSRDVAGGGRGP